MSDNIDPSDINAQIDALNDKMFHSSLEHGQEVLDEYIGRFGFSSMAEYDEYANKPITRDLIAHVEDRPLNVIMVTEKNALAREVANLLGRQYEVEKFRYGRADKPIVMTVYKFRCRLLGRIADVKMIATNGHLFKQNFYHIDDEMVKEPLMAKIFDKCADGKFYFEEFLTGLITDCDLVYLMLDDDHEGEYIAFEVIHLIKDVYEKINAPKKLDMKRFMDCFLRIKFSSAAEVKQKPCRPDLRRALAMVAKHYLDLRYGVSMSRVQKFAARTHLPDRYIARFSFRPCGNICVALVNQYAAKNRSSTVKYCLEFDVHIDDKSIKFSYGEFTEDEAEKKRKEIQKCSVKEGPIRGSTQTVKSPAGLNTFELMKHLSRYYKIDTSAIAQTAQALYEKGLISYPRSETSKYPEHVQVNVKQYYDNLLKMCAFINVSSDIIKFEPDHKVSFEKAWNKGVNHFDHPPIMPTRRGLRSNDNLSKNMIQVYYFVCTHFLASFMDDYRYYEEKVVFDFGNLEVPFSWFKEESAGFTELLPELKVETLDDGMAALLAENLRPGATFPKFDVRVKECPKPALLKEYELVQYMEDNNIGTDGSIPGHICKIEWLYYVRIDIDTFEFHETPLGKIMTDSHLECIPEFITPKFRADFIRHIENIASGKEDFVPVYNKSLRTFNESFHKLSKYFPKFVEENLAKFAECFDPKPADPVPEAKVKLMK